MGDKSTKKSAKKNEKQERSFDLFFERSLTKAAKAGELPPAFEVDTDIARVAEAIGGGRSPIIMGEVGVGKSAIVMELVRRSLKDEHSPLYGKRVLQFSLMRCAATLSPNQRVAAKLIELVAQIAKLGDEVVAYFRDFHLAYRFDLEHIFESISYRLPNPVIAEGEISTVRTMMQAVPGLETDFALVEIREPSLARARVILQTWSEEQSAQREVPIFDEHALETGLQLAFRFLSRSRLPRKVIEPMSQLAAIAPEGATTDEAAVIDSFCQTYGLPRGLVDPDTPLNLDELRSQFRSKVLGQAEAVESMIQMIGRVKAGLIDPRRPFGVFLFVGPTGVGKTHLASMLAQFLLGSADRLIRLNMADFPGENQAGVLFGDPNGHELDEKRGVLTSRVSGHTLAVLLLDEFEKANTLVHDRFLQLFDEGCFINGLGQTISCRSMIIIATSNAGAELWRGGSLGFLRSGSDSDLVSELDQRLHEHFRFEFLNRFDQIVHFRALEREHIRTIAKRELLLLQERAGLRQRNHNLEFDEDVLDWLTAHGYDPYYGARFLRRTIEREISTPVAELLVHKRPPRGVPVRLVVRGQRVRALLAGDPGAESPNRHAVQLPDVLSGAATKNLDEKSLTEEAELLIQASAARRDGLQAKQGEYAALRTRINEEQGFWKDRQQARIQLDRFRELDVDIRIETRYASALERLEDEISREDTSLEELAQALEQAAHSLKEWDLRFAEDAESAVWIVISKQDPTIDTGGWLAELAQLELAWCERLELEAEVIGYAMQNDEVVRIGIEVVGPGAGLFLAMEQGLHRRYRSQDKDFRARIDIIPQGSSEGELRPPVEPVRQRKAGPFEFTPTQQARLRLERIGQTQDFFSSDAEALKQMLADIRKPLSDPSESPPDVARIYGGQGHGAQDPRTNASLPKLKDALKGRLEPLLNAWRDRWA